MSPLEELIRVLRSERRIKILSPWVTLTPDDLRDLLGADDILRARDETLVLDLKRMMETTGNGEPGGTDPWDVIVAWAAEGFEVHNGSFHKKLYVGDDKALTGSMNLTRKGVRGLKEGEENLSEEDPDRAEEEVEAAAEKTLALPNPNRGSRWKVFLVERDDGTVGLRPYDPDEEEEYPFPILVKEGDKHAKGFVFDGRILRLKHDREWKLVRIEDVTGRVRDASTEDVEDILKPFRGLRLIELNPDGLKLVTTTREELLRSTVGSRGKVEEYLRSAEKAFGSRVREVRRIWGLTPYVTWKSYEKGGRELPYLPPASNSRLLYLRFEGKAIKFVRYATDVSEIADILVEEFGSPSKFRGLNVDLGAAFLADGRLVPVLAKAPRKRGRSRR